MYVAASPTLQVDGWRVVFTGDEAYRASHHAAGSASGGRQSTASSQDSITSTEDVAFQPRLPPSPPGRDSCRSKNSAGSTPPPPPPPPPGPNRPFNPMADALDAIKRNRKFSDASDWNDGRRTSGMGLQGASDDDQKEDSVPSMTRARSARSRDSQLSAEGKRMLARALSQHVSSKPISRSSNPTADRKGLFDSSSSEDDDDSGPAVDRDPFPLAHAPPTAAIPAVLSVSYVSAVVEVRQGKSIAIYRFAFRVDASTPLQCEFGFSYHEFDAIHGDLKRSITDDLPKFPSKHLLRNPTKPDNMQKRAAEFLVYLQALVQLRSVAAHPSFHASFGVPPDMAATLVRGTVAHASPPATSTTSGAASSRKSHHPSVHKAMPGLPKPPKRNLFDDDVENERASVASSVEPPEPMEQSVVAPPMDRPRSTSHSTRRLDLDDRPQKKETRPPSAKAQLDRPPSSKAMNVTGRPNLFGGGRGDLLAAIRQGAKLNKVAQPDDTHTPHTTSLSGASVAPRPSMPPPPANSLLAALQSAPPLRKSTDQPTEPSTVNAVRPLQAAPLAAPTIHDSIAMVMATRQKHTQYDPSDDEASDDEWDD
ncbi:hypothetical protein, variant [Aphanomyces invadans]|uniref:PX domain-containing protein n=1 Tax=Aphanomyces invadans TaxID=157072 RepID=A0A024TQG2_9STRA|nr:hypothetical protein, variant [Aphanomyces invadans]ETV96370.1 hypothetical protein, variant [Aphanomyces invadans]|eukprot:XP_008875162.1 hypothetical protein, variant [Aphanomyces invadans]